MLSKMVLDKVEDCIHTFTKRHNSESLEQLTQNLIK